MTRIALWIVNLVGRLVEVETDSASMITDEWFSYDADGRPTDLYESTPHSGGYYHSSASYWANGGLDTLGLFSSAGSSLIPLQTYGADGEGRPSSVTAASGQNPVSSVTYTASGTTEPIGSLTNVTFGSLDSDSFQYNPSTGRMTKYTLSVNGQSEVGTLSWNANGTLGQLAITDPFNTQNNQTCTNTYDDLARISGNSCGSTWAQTFSYDPFGNISKSGSISWQPTYSTSSNNQYLSGWNGVSYDADGNLLNDTFNTYTWNVSGLLASVNTAAVTYDALGRMVENQSGAYEYIYSPFGGPILASVVGQNPGSAIIPLPGGAVAVYNGLTLAQYNHADWLGSARLFSSASRSAIPAMAYAPFGEGYAGGQAWVQFTSAGFSWTLFDSENQTGSLQDFMFRRYNPTQGRWISPDPAGLAAVNPTNPQTWNRYAYVANNPLSYVDPLGLQLMHPCSGSPQCNNGDIVLDGNGRNIIGIQNSNAQDLSTVDHVSFYKIFGTGLMVSGNAQHSGPYSNIVFDTGTSPTAPTACAQIEGVSGGTRGIHGLTCVSSTVGQTAVFLDSSNNSLEDVRINGFVDGILVGSNGIAKSNVLINITGDTVPWNSLAQMPIYIVHVSNAQTSGQANVSDLAVVGVSNAGGTSTSTILDDLTSTMFGDQVALYVLGESANGGYSRFTTSHNAATWAVGTNPPTPSSPCPTGSLYTVTGSGGHLYVCAKGSTPTWTLVQ
jgi:RHS repeat-associated protein